MQVRILPFVRTCGNVLSRQTNVAAPVTVEGQRNLTTNPKYKTPYPSWLPFNRITSCLDFTSTRLNENSRLILVDGPPGVGKSAFVDEMAAHFKLRACHGYQPKDWYMENGLDKREMNDYIQNPKFKVLDVDTFYREPVPDLRFGAKQMQIFLQRWNMYADSLYHLLSTGISFLSSVLVYVFLFH